MADNTFVNIGGHKVSAGIKYSTSEVKTGNVWIDGKPIYRLTVPCTMPSTSGTVGNTPHGASNVDKVIKCWGWTSTSDESYFFPIPFAASSSYIQGQANRTNITLVTNLTNTFGRPVYMTIEYTKTTD